MTELTKKIQDDLIEEFCKNHPMNVYNTKMTNEELTEKIMEVCKMLSENKPPKFEVFIGNYTICNKLNCIDKTLYANGMYIEYSDSKDMKDYIEIYKDGKFLLRRKIEIV